MIVGSPRSSLASSSRCPPLPPEAANGAAGAVQAARSAAASFGTSFGRFTKKKKTPVSLPNLNEVLECNITVRSLSSTKESINIPQKERTRPRCQKQQQPGPLHGPPRVTLTVSAAPWAPTAACANPIVRHRPRNTRSQVATLSTSLRRRVEPWCSSRSFPR